VPAFKIEADSPLTAWGQVNRDLRRRLEEGEFPPGSKLPSEADVAAEYGVSRVTVRRALQALVADGYLTTRRGSGTFVNDRDSVTRFDVDLLRPWREQLLSSGNVARSRLLSYEEQAELPEELHGVVRFDDADRLSLGLHVQEVNGVPIAMSESWIPVDGKAALLTKARSAIVSAAGWIRIAFATAEQAQLLQSYRDVPLLEVTTHSRLRETGELVELARTRWIASRVRCAYHRTLTIGQIDMSELLTNR